MTVLPMGPRATLPSLLLGVLATGACGGGGSTTPGPVPSPTPAGHDLVAVVFYDEDGDGQLSPGEVVRIPDAEVAAGGRTARTEKVTGRAVVRGVPAGTQSVTLRTETLPPFFQGAAPATVEVPAAAGSEVLFPVTLDIGPCRPNLYMAFGDSITRGDGSTFGGYPPVLQSMLVAHFGGAVLTNQGRDATNSFEGADRARRNVRAQLPAYTLILYGTNDWHAPECQDDPRSPRCPTVENLRKMVQAARDFQSLPVVGTIPPVNPAFNPPGRNEWYEDVNELIRAMAREEGAAVADLYGAFDGQADMSALFSDSVHPSDAGYRLIAEAFFEAIAHGRSTAAGAEARSRRP